MGKSKNGVLIELAFRWKEYKINRSRDQGEKIRLEKIALPFDLTF